MPANENWGLMEQERFAESLFILPANSQESVRDRIIRKTGEMQDFLEKVTEHHEKLRKRAEAPNTSETFLKILEALDVALRESIQGTGQLASIFFDLHRRGEA